jgi:rhodanese-related sulfurtransferase
MPNTPSDSVREISIEEFDEMIENHDDLLVVDVRAAAEFHRGHIPGALLLPREIIEATTDHADRAGAENFPWARQKTLVLCSQDGSRCGAPATRLQLMGFEKIYSLAGGINRWLAQGYVLVAE